MIDEVNMNGDRETDRGSRIADRGSEQSVQDDGGLGCGQSPRDLRRATALLLILFAWGALGADAPSTRNNDDSCDVMVTPAATLLLPYFEVDQTNAAGETTLFTVSNVVQTPQIVHVTIWTDWSFPLFSFNIFLTGYDVQSINLFDIIARGRIAEPGTTSDSDVGRRSLENDENPLLDISNCDGLKVQIPPNILESLQTALVTGRTAACGNARVGGQHVHAVGYLTIDVTESCTGLLPIDPGYFTSEILYDNVLTGDYQQINSTQNFAQGGTMVHIRAIPEGGAPGAKPTNFGRTFYSNYQNGGTADRRQPLPSTFAARWISAGTSNFDTSFKVWREGVTHSNAGCAVSANGVLRFADVVRFDEDENPSAFEECQICIPIPIAPPHLPSASRARSSSSDIFPPNPDGDVAGWMYMNFDHQGIDPFNPNVTASQNWVSVSMAAEGRYSVDFDAVSLGNGCTAPEPVTDKDGATPAIGPPVPGMMTRPPFESGSPATVANDDSCDIKVTPAATLLLPYFEVDVTNPAGETTLFTVTNVTRFPQIARVTIWTDYAFPVLTFNLFLTGYDIQSINLFDVLARGRIAEPGTTSHTAVGRRSKENDENPFLDVSACGSLADRVTPAVQFEILNALTTGRTQSCGSARVGSTHVHAIGYVTIDVVQNCGSTLPTDPGYFTTQVLYDNALTGDYQQVNSTQNFAQGNAMVHIRAIPEGGVPGAGETSFRRTFYSRLQNGGTADRRQPLPSTFAARWISGGSTAFDTTFKIWREAVTGATAGCAVSANSQIEVPDMVRFDEEENPTTHDYYCEFYICPQYVLPPVSRFRASDYNFPSNPDGAVAGWMYLNLHDERYYETEEDESARQSWVVVSMTADGRYSVDFDATALGNGCSLFAPVTDEDGHEPVVGPAPNVNP
jgi:hypothetical protein